MLKAGSYVRRANTRMLSAVCSILPPFREFTTHPLAAFPEHGAGMITTKKPQITSESSANDT